MNSLAILVKAINVLRLQSYNKYEEWDREYCVCFVRNFQNTSISVMYQCKSIYKLKKNVLHTICPFKHYEITNMNKQTITLRKLRKW